VRSAETIELEEEEESKSGRNRCEIWKQVGPSKEERGRDLRGRNKKGGSDTNKALERIRMRRELNF